jgi:hypothetical protein
VTWLICISNLADLHIKSVEDLAAVSDVHVTKIIHGRDLRAKAVAWIAAHPSRQEASEPAKLREQNEMLVKRIIALEAARTVPTPPAAKLLSQNPAEAPKPHRSKAQLEQMARMRAAKAAKSATRAVTINTAELP